MEHSNCLLVKRYPVVVRPDPVPDQDPYTPAPLVPPVQQDCDSGYTKVPVGPPINGAYYDLTICAPPVYAPEDDCPTTYIIVTPGLISPGCMGSFIKKCTILCDGTQICDTTFQHSCSGYGG